MKNRILTALALLAALAGVAGAQSYFDRLKSGATAGEFLSAINLHPGLLCKYIGTNSLGGTVTVAAGGDITFSVGAVGASAVSTTIECPVSGAAGGIFDLSTPAAACDTVGEILDLINTSTSDFACVAPGLLRSDATDNRFFTLTETAANAAEGLQIPVDETTQIFTTWAVMPAEYLTDIRNYRAPQGRPGLFFANPWQGYRTDLWKSILQTTYGSGTSTLAILNVKPDLNAKSQTVTTVWSQAAGATATDQTLDWTPVGGLQSRDDSYFLLRITNSVEDTASKGSVVGVMYKKQGP